MSRLVDIIQEPRFRLYMSAALLVLCIVGWPVSMFTWAKGEPPTVLALSWLALIISALTMLMTADVRVQQEDDE